MNNRLESKNRGTALVWVALLIGLLPGLHENYWRFVKKNYYEQGASCGLIRGYAREFETQNGRKPDDTELFDWCAARFTKAVAGMEYAPDAIEMQFRSS